MRNQIICSPKIPFFFITPAKCAKKSICSTTLARFEKGFIYFKFPKTSSTFGDCHVSAEENNPICPQAEVSSLSKSSAG